VVAVRLRSALRFAGYKAMRHLSPAIRDGALFVLHVCSLDPHAVSRRTHGATTDANTADASSGAANSDGATDRDDSSSADASSDVATAANSDGGEPPSTPLAPWRLPGPPLSQRPAQGSGQGGGQAAAAAAAPRPSWSQRPSEWRPQRLQQGPRENDDGPCVLLPESTITASVASVVRN